MTEQEITDTVREAVRDALAVQVAPRLLTVEQVCQALHVSQSRLYLLVQQGRIRSFKEGKRRLFPVAALDEYVAARQAEEQVSA